MLKAEDVRFMDIHFAQRVFYPKLLQIRPSSVLTCVPQSLRPLPETVSYCTFLSFTLTLSFLISASP